MPLLFDYLVTDDLTILLGLIAVTVFLLYNLYKPQPLVHPILLGRQSDVARVRNQGESAVYRNYGTGMMGRLPIRPEKDVHVLSDLVRPDFDSLRTLWSTKITNAQLRDRAAAFGTGLIRAVGLVPHESNVLLLLNDSIEFLISDLALSSHSIPSFTLSTMSLLSPVLDLHPPSAIITHDKFLAQVLELIYDSHEGDRPTIIVVGEPDAKHVGKRSHNVHVLKWSDIEKAGAQGEKVISSAPNPIDVFTVSFFESKTGQLQGAQLTHENITAGVTATRTLLPLSNAITPLDTIVSSHSLSTAFGRTVAYTALFEGTSFATTHSSKILHDTEGSSPRDLSDIFSAKSYPIPSPTILFTSPSQVESLTSAILRHAQKSFFTYTFAWRHKAAGIAEGFITRESLWDRLVFDAARAQVLNEDAGFLRAVIASGGSLKASSLTSIRIALSVPFVNAHTHPLVAGPVFASHPLDLQSFPPSLDDHFGDVAHVGPPSTNIEAKLVDVQDDHVENGGDPIGTLILRGPTVAKVLSVGEETEAQVDEDKEGWATTTEKARVSPNGAFKVSRA